MSLDSIASDVSKTTVAATIAIVESYLRSCQVDAHRCLLVEAKQIVHQVAESCHAYASDDQRQLCRLSLRLASQSLSGALMQNAPQVIPTETPVRMSAAAAVRMAAPIRFSYWRDMLRPARLATLTAKSYWKTLSRQ